MTAKSRGGPLLFARGLELNRGRHDPSIDNKLTPVRLPFDDQVRQGLPKRNPGRHRQALGKDLPEDTVSLGQMPAGEDCQGQQPQTEAEQGQGASEHQVQFPQRGLLQVVEIIADALLNTVLVIGAGRCRQIDADNEIVSAEFVVTADQVVDELGSRSFFK